MREVVNGKRIIDGYAEFEVGVSVKAYGIAVSDSHKMVVVGVPMGIVRPSLMDAVRCYLNATPRIEWRHVIPAEEIGYQPPQD